MGIIQWMVCAGGCWFTMTKRPFFSSIQISGFFSKMVLRRKKYYLFIYLFIIIIILGVVW
jgi:hypothetical protein